MKKGNGAGSPMNILSYIVAFLLLVTAAVSLALLVDRIRRKAFEKARADQIREANRPVSVWICRYCGFMSLMRNQMCTGCGVPRPEEFVYRTISARDFAAQLRNSSSKSNSECPGKSGDTPPVTCT